MKHTERSFFGDIDKDHKKLIAKHSSYKNCFGTISSTFDYNYAHTTTGPFLGKSDGLYGTSLQFMGASNICRDKGIIIRV